MPDSKTVSLLDRAMADRSLSETALSMFSDEVHIDLAAFLIQQAVEKCVKYIAEQRGIEYSYQHFLSVFLRETKMPDVEELVAPFADTLDVWQSKTRYGKYILSTKSKVEAAIAMFDKLAKIAEGCQPNKSTVAEESQRYDWPKR